MSHYSLMITRMSLGLVLLAHGLLKIFVFTIPGTVSFFESLGFPALLTYATIGIEVMGGALLLINVFSLYAALLSVPILLGATYVHLPNGWVFSNSGGGYEFPLLLVVLAVSVVVAHLPQQSQQSSQES